MDAAIQSKINEVKVMEKYIPAMIVVHDIRDSSVVYMSKEGLKGLGVSLQELIEMGPDYHSKFFNTEDAKEYVPKILGLLERNNDDELVSFFQQVKQMPSGDWVWFLSSTKILLRNEENIPILILTTSIPVDPQHHVSSKAKKLHEETNFSRSNTHLFNKLTDLEKEVLKLTGTRYSIRKISAELHISESSVSTQLKNIHTKLTTKTPYDLTRFAQAFDLI